MSTVEAALSTLSLSDASTIPKQSKGRTFYDLPGEIRNQIYKYLLSPAFAIPGPLEDPQRTKVLFDRSHFIGHLRNRKIFSVEDSSAQQENEGKVHPRTSVAYKYKSSLLQASRQIYKEASPIFYNENQFVCFLTSSPGLCRVLRECGFMRVSQFLKNDQWVATIKLRWDINDHIQYVFVIPSEELWILARIFIKANISHGFFFSSCNLRIYISDSLPFVSYAFGSELFTVVRQLYNVLDMKFDKRLEPHIPPTYALVLPESFAWESFLGYVREDYTHSHELYFVGDMVSALTWAKNAVDDMDGGRDTHYIAWKMKGERLKSRSCELRQELALWVYKIELEIDPTTVLTFNVNDPKPCIPTFSELDADSRAILSLAWELTVCLGEGHLKESSELYDKMYTHEWSGGSALARCLHQEIKSGMDCWLTVSPKDDNFINLADQILQRDKKREGWMEMNEDVVRGGLNIERPECKTTCSSLPDRYQLTTR